MKENIERGNRIVKDIADNNENKPEQVLLAALIYLCFDSRPLSEYNVNASSRDPIGYTLKG